MDGTKQEKKPVFFWRNPVTSLSITLLAVVAMTGILVYCLPMGDSAGLRRNGGYSLFTLPGNYFGAGKSSLTGRAGIEARLSWIERNLESGHPAYALDEVKTILVLDPSNREALLLAAELYDELKLHDEQLDCLRRLYGAYPEAANAYFLAQALWRNDRNAEALAVLEQARPKVNYSPSFELLLAELYAAAGDDEAALRAWRAAGEPGDAVWRAGYAALARLLRLPEPEKEVDSEAADG